MLDCSRSYELGFQNNETYQDWRRALHFGGINLTEEHPNHFPIKTLSPGAAGDDINGTRVKSDTSILAEVKNPLLAIDPEATKKYYRVLRKDERVICSGLVFKIEKLGSAGTATHKQKRILVLTDNPRLIFLDTIGNIVRGHLELSKDGKTDAKMVFPNADADDADADAA